MKFLHTALAAVALWAAGTHGAAVKTTGAAMSCPRVEVNIRKNYRPGRAGEIAFKLTNNGARSLYHAGLVVSLSDRLLKASRSIDRAASQRPAPTFPPPHR